jgi:uncharacterized protein YjbJ (UPF0337 family)
MADKNRIKGAAQKIKGQIKTAVGKIVGNKKIPAGGKVDEAAGAVHKPVGEAKDAGRAAKSRWK